MSVQDSSRNLKKRSRSPSPPPWRRSNKTPRQEHAGAASRSDLNGDDGFVHRNKQESFAREQTRLNQILEAEQMREWVSREDDFVLKQSKKKAQIRVREGRAKPIDWLAIVLSVVDPTRNLLEDDGCDPEIDVVDPSGVIEDLEYSELQVLEKDIDSYAILETNKSNQEYWNAMKIVCQDKRQRLAPVGMASRMSTSISSDIDRLLGPKSYEELDILKGQISAKLGSNENIDVEYWDQLLRRIEVHKAIAQAKRVYQSVIDSRLASLKAQQVAEAVAVQEKLAVLLGSFNSEDAGSQDEGYREGRAKHFIRTPVVYSISMDPEPQLRLRTEDKGLEVVEESDFLSQISTARQKVLTKGYIPIRQRQPEKVVSVQGPKNSEASNANAPRFSVGLSEDFSQATTALYEREVARGVQEDEEIFAGEEDISTLSKPQWINKYRPRKPRYFNRVQMGYEWNKYNQTHYDHDNPPPRVVQGYKFNIFYPDLIDKVKAPTYHIERENGRKRGQSFAPAGEEDTCLIRFISGPPYEDLAFRIVDKEWDYSAKRERGFRSSFDKGILQLHFQFKKVYYRK